jgi:hypothetical protein
VYRREFAVLENTVRAVVIAAIIHLLVKLVLEMSLRCCSNKDVRVISFAIDRLWLILGIRGGAPAGIRSSNFSVADAVNPEQEALDQGNTAGFPGTVATFVSQVSW